MAGRPNNPVRTDFEAILLGYMATANINDYATLADKADLSTSAIQRLCSEKTSPSYRSPSIGTLKKLAAALGVTVNDLL